MAYLFFLLNGILFCERPKSLDTPVSRCYLITRQFSLCLTDVFLRVD